MSRIAARPWTTLVQAGRPPLRARRFWIVQLLVVLIAVLHLAADRGLTVPPLGIPHFATVALFLVPIVYAALNFGLSGALATAIWVTLLSLPDLLVWDDGQDRWNDWVQLMVVDAIAVFVGERVERERRARHRAEEAEKQIKTYARRILHSQEEERRRIAQELHDDPLQALIYLVRRLEALAEVSELPAPAKHEVERVRSVATETAASLREIARGLRPPSLDDLGLVPAIRQLVSTTEGRHDDRTVDLRLSGHPRRLPAECELGLYRIAQEALNNVDKHAGARNVRVRLSFRRDGVVLSVSDDGRGFARGDADRSMGLPGMRERASLIGGELGVESTPGRGTIVRAAVPIQPDDRAEWVQRAERIRHVTRKAIRWPA